MPNRYVSFRFKIKSNLKQNTKNYSEKIRIQITNQNSCMHVESPNFTFSSIILEYSLRTSTLFIYLIFYFVFEYREYMKNKKSPLLHFQSPP